MSDVDHGHVGSASCVQHRAHPFDEPLSLPQVPDDGHLHVVDQHADPTVPAGFLYRLRYLDAVQTLHPDSKLCSLRAISLWGTSTGFLLLDDADATAEHRDNVV